MTLLPFFRALHIAATILIAGAFAFEALILRPAGRTAQPAMSDWLKRQCAWGIAVGLASWFGWVGAIAVAMSGLPATQALTPEVLGTVVGDTTFGHVWAIRLALLVVVAAMVLWPRRRFDQLGAVHFAVVVALVASLAWTGHALGTSRMHVWIDASHLLAAAAWLGMLPPLLGLVGLAIRQPDPWRSLAVASVRRFYLPGVVAVLVLAASGVANTSWMLGSVADLANTGYGRVLSMKVLLFALMLVLATVNRFVIVPRVERSGHSAGALGSLYRSVLAELVLGAAVIAVVAWLGVTPPAGHAMDHMMEGM